MRIGIIGDSHGYAHPAIGRVFAGVELIVHTGDAGSITVINELRAISDLIGVRGNYDLDPELSAALLPDPSPVTIAGRKALLTHRLITMDFDHNAELIARMTKNIMPGAELFVFGHTHHPVLRQVDGLWFVNPGYSGPDPLEGPPTAIILEISEQSIAGRIVNL